MTFLSFLSREKEYSVLCIYDMLVTEFAAMESLLNIRNILFLKTFLGFNKKPPLSTLYLIPHNYLI